MRRSARAAKGRTTTAVDRALKISRGNQVDSIRWTSTLIFTFFWLSYPARKISLQPVTCLGWAARLLTAFKTHLKCWEAPGSCWVVLMRKMFEEQPWLSGLRAQVPHGGEDGLLLLPHSLQCFWQVILPALVMLVTLQQVCKSLSNLREVELSFMSVL